ncbi:MAG: carbohydrate-binding protein, partial [Bacteroidales bacterium]|nr:carbohydrate-binding protein [Bacteroidales bacterium]
AKDPQTGMYVSQIHNGDYLKVQAVDFNKGAKRFDVSASATTQGGSIEIRLDAPDGQLLGTCAIGQTDGWKTFSSKIQKVKGVHDVYLVFKGGSDELFQLDWWMLKK